VGDVLTVDCQQSFIHASSRMAAAIGLEEYCVAEARDAALVTPKGREQDVKKIVDQLKRLKRDETILHRRGLIASGLIPFSAWPVIAPKIPLENLC